MSGNMLKLTALVIWVLFTNFDKNPMAQKSVRKCDQHYCNAPSKLVEPEPQKMTVEMTRTKFAMRAAPRKAEIIYSRRNWLAIYCYDGGSIDSNTGCYESVTQMTPTCSESRDWISKGFCRTGRECAPDGDCWGKDSNLCTQYNPPMINNVGPTSLKWAGERWMLFAQHTCVSSWECLIFKTEVDIFAEIINGKESYYYMDKDNKKHIYSEKLYNEGDKDAGGNTQCLASAAENYESVMVEATCFGESREKIKCILISGDEWDGVVIDVQQAEVAVLRNAIFHLKGPMYVPDGNGKIINVGKTEYSNSYVNGLTHVYELTRAASIEDVLELSYSLTGAQMQTVFNLLKVSDRVVTIEKMIIKMIRSLSIVDPDLLHQITGGIPYSIKWQTPDIFETCSCYDIGEFTNSNCNGEYMYKDGSYVDKNDTSLCRSYYEEEIKNVSLFKNLKVDTTAINMLPPQMASSDSSAWDSLADWRNDKISGDHTSHSYKNLEDKIKELSNTMGIGGVTKWFWFATAAVAWIAGLVSIGPCLCRGRN